MSQEITISVLILITILSSCKPGPTNFCGEANPLILTKSSGSIVSHALFDGTTKYGNRADCKIIIKNIKGNITFLQFKHFKLESSTNCKYDNLTVKHLSRDGIIKQTTLCGYTIPPDIVSSNGEVTLTFKTDGDVKRSGFKLTYNVVLHDFCGEANPLILTKSSGSIVSHALFNGTSKYGNETHCKIIIKNIKGNNIFLHFKHFNLEYHANCSYDNLTVKHLSRDGIIKQTTLCGSTIPPDIVSSNGDMTLTFKTDISLELSGFKLTYKVIPQVLCGEANPLIITNSSGSIVSHALFNGTTKYQNGTICKIIIENIEGNTIFLHFKHFDLEYCDDCICDNLTIKHLSPTGIIKQTTFCGSTIPPDIASSNGDMTLIFKTDINTAYTGFNLTYEIIPQDYIHVYQSNYIRYLPWISAPLGLVAVIAIVIVVVVVKKRINNSRVLNERYQQEMQHGFKLHNCLDNGTYNTGTRYDNGKKCY